MPRCVLPLGLLVLMLGCLTPVSESNDSGHGGGMAGGASGGGGTAGGAAGGGLGGSGGSGTDGGGQCDVAADCGGTRPSVQFCSAITGASFSCINRQCLWECNGGRTCSIGSLDGQPCEQCGMVTSCELGNCKAIVRAAQVESSTCASYPGTQVPFPGDSWQLSGTDCRFDAHQSDGGIRFGTVSRLDDGDFVADFGPLGGQCTGIGLPTGLERWLFNCPGCQFVLRL